MNWMKLIRVARHEDGVFGVLLHNTVPFAVTLEPEDRGNQRNVSCIPAGLYTCQRIVSPRFGETFEVLNVPNRSHILFHKGNVEDDSMGCILVGEQFEALHGKVAILRSKKGFEEFLSRLGPANDTFTLEVVWA